MSIEDQASLVEAKLDEIQNALYEAKHLCELVKKRDIVGGVNYEFSEEQKEALIVHYGKVKARIQALVEELP